MSDLANMIDRVMESGEWRMLQIGRTAASSIREKDLSAANCSQLPADDLFNSPSDHLRDLLEFHLQEGRWA